MSSWATRTVGDDPWVAVNQGYEIQIDATDADDRTTGSVYSFQSADIPARDAALHPPGEWNTYEIVVQGQTIKVYLNGALINDFVSTDPARDLTQGFVGIQNHGDGDDVFFRNIQIKEIADEAAPVTTATFADAGAGRLAPGHRAGRAGGHRRGPGRRPHRVPAGRVGLDAVHRRRCP